MEQFISVNKKTFKENTKAFFAHPLFGYIILMAIFVLVQLLNAAGIVDISFTRACGKVIIYSIVSLGFGLLLGFGGLASLGTAGFMGAGTYMLGYFMQTLSLSFGVTLVLSIIFAILLGVIVGFISLRIEGMYLAIITLGLSEILVELFKSLDAITNGINGFVLKKYPIIFGFQLNRATTYYLLIAFLFIVILLTRNIMMSPTGRAMLAMKNSESAAQAMGVSLLKYRLLAFVFATVYACIAGLLYICYIKFTEPTGWNISLSLNILAAVIIGGSKSIWGIIGGALFIFGLNELVLQNIPFFVQNPNFILMINGVFIILIIMFYPGGLAQLFAELKYKIKKFQLRLREAKYGK